MEGMPDAEIEPLTLAELLAELVGRSALDGWTMVLGAAELVGTYVSRPAVVVAFPWASMLGWALLMTKPFEPAEAVGAAPREALGTFVTPGDLLPVPPPPPIALAVTTD